MRNLTKPSAEAAAAAARRHDGDTIYKGIYDGRARLHITHTGPELGGSWGGRSVVPGFRNRRIGKQSQGSK